MRVDTHVTEVTSPSTVIQPSLRDHGDDGPLGYAGSATLASFQPCHVSAAWVLGRSSEVVHDDHR